MIPSAIRTKLALPLLFAGLLAARLCHSGIVWVEEAYPSAAAIQMLFGKSLYRDIWFDKPPLSAAVYLLWGAHAGVPLRIAGAIFVFLCCLLIARFARHLWTAQEGLTAALLLGFFLTFGIPSAVMAMAPDLLMILPHLAAVYLAWRKRPLLSGLLAGIALLVNSKAVFVLAACLLFTGRSWPLLLAGFALPNLLALAWFGRAYWDQVWKWGALYSAQPFALEIGFTRTLNWAGFHAAIILAAAFALWRERNWRMLAWLILSAAAVAAGWRFFPRYYFQLLPVLVILAARGYTLLGRKRAIIWLLLLIPLVRFGPRYVTLALGREPNWSDLRMNQDSRDAASHIAREGTLLVWGYRPDVFVYTRLPAGTRFLDSQPLTGVLADRHLTTSEPVAPELAAQNRRELLTTSPTWIVDGLGPLNPKLAITQYSDLRDWPGAYQEVARTMYSVVYRRGAETGVRSADRVSAPPY
ncbi:MAG: hypothetical protein M3O35_15705 [Acidobacteriota bacterium]|nr:hypothetical protein [Acidobacteriota bacterium]